MISFLNNVISNVIVWTNLQCIAIATDCNPPCINGGKCDKQAAVPTCRYFK